MKSGPRDPEARRTRGRTCWCWGGTPPTSRPRAPSSRRWTSALGGLLSQRAGEPRSSRASRARSSPRAHRRQDPRGARAGGGPRARTGGAADARGRGARAARRPPRCGARAIWARPPSRSSCLPDGLPRAGARPGHRGGRAARHLSLREVPEGEERQGGARRSPCSSPTGAARRAARDGRAARPDLGRGHVPRPRPGQRAGQRGDAHLPRPPRGRDRARGRAHAQGAGPRRVRQAWAWAPTWAWPRAARSRPSSST